MNKPSNDRDSAKKRCFMITPSGPRSSQVRKQADWVYRFVRAACDGRGFELERADTMPGSAMITTRIFEAIQQVDVCIADLSGLNANVFYELGIRHSLALPVIHIASEGTELPFDNAQHDAIFYDISSIDSMDGLTDAVGRQLDVISTPTYAVSNPFTAALGTVKLQQSGDPRDKVIARLDERLSMLEHTLVPQPSRQDFKPDQLLAEALRRFKTASRSIQLDLDLVRDALAAIPPWRVGEVQALYTALLEADGIANKADARAIFDERHPDLIPF